MVHAHERLVPQGITGRRTQERAIFSEAEAWRERYRLAWRRRWFDQQAKQGSTTRPGRR
jgi:hypothetical protein